MSEKARVVDCPRCCPKGSPGAGPGWVWIEISEDDGYSEPCDLCEGTGEVLVEPFDRNRREETACQ